MAKYRTHILVAFGGGFVNTEEEWSSGIRVTSDSAQMDSATLEAIIGDYLTTASAAVTQWFGREATGISNFCELEWVKANVIGPNGKYAFNQTRISDLGGNKKKGGAVRTQPVYPTQISLVHTFETKFSRGYASKGRMFVPAPALGMELNYLLNPNNTASVAASTAKLLEDLTTTASNGQELFPAVLSGNDGEYNRITKVTIDNRLDTQRSRATRLAYGAARASSPVNA